MPIAFFSLVLILLGILCGAALVAVPLGLTVITAGPMIWVLFPLFVIGGFVLLAMGASAHAVHRASRPAALALLLLALVAAVVLVAGGIGLLPGATADAPAWPLWYVLVVAGGIGVLGAASFRGKTGAG